MTPGTDHSANPIFPSPAIRKTAEKSAGDNLQRRSSSWSHYHSRQPSNPFFLSRRAKEQGSFVRDKRGDRKSATLDETLNNPDIRGNLGLAIKPSTLHIVGISEEVESGESLGNRKRGIALQAKTYPVQRNAAEKHGIEKSIAPNAVKTAERLPNKKNTINAGNNSLPKFNFTAPEHSAGLACNSADLPDEGLLNQSRLHRHGTVRRKIMRTVSQDDYLLARGANPRTGVVTPSLHSGSSSIDDQELFKIRELSQQAKWRLKGDEWVSLGLDEPSPLPTPPSEANGRRLGRLLRIPPKLAHGGQPQSRTKVHDLERPKMYGMPATAQSTGQLYQTGHRNGRMFPGPEEEGNRTQATALPARAVPKTHDGLGKETTIRRKPLGTPPHKSTAEMLFRNQELPEPSTETVITKAGPSEQPRSSSMPTPRKIRYFGPEDVGKALPALPMLPDSKAKANGNVKQESPSPAIPFLGLRTGDRTEDCSKGINLNAKSLGKESRCPPTNDIQFQSHRLGRTNMKGPSAISRTMHTNRFGKQPRQANFPPHTEGQSSGLPRLRPTILPRHYQLKQETNAEQGTEQRNIVKTTFPAYPSSLQARPQVQSTCINGMATTRSKEDEAKIEVHPSQSTIIPTTTPTFTMQTAPEDRLVSSSWREVPSPLRPGRLRANTTLRPAMPDRAEGTHSVPQVSPQKEQPGQNQWRMTGMSDSDISAASTSVEGSPERDLIPRPLRPSNANTAALARIRGVAAGAAADVDPLTKNCQRCQEASLGAKQHNTHGFIHTQGSLQAENIDPQLDLSIASGFLQGTPEDHSGCCPECCAVGCHGSCLGHRSPLTTRSASGFASGLGAMKEVFRNSMRLSRRIRVRTSAGGSQETETEEVAELETPMSWEVGGPVSLGMPSKMSPQDFWGDCGHAKVGSRGERTPSDGSASSVKTCEIPSNPGVAAVIEALIVPFGALSMWLKTHPQLLALMQIIALKLLEMSRHVLQTMGSAYRVAYIYSKTGRISPGKHSSLSGFVRDCVKAVVFSLVLAAVIIMVGRVLAVFAGAGRCVIWCLSWVMWIVKAVGLGILW